MFTSRFLFDTKKRAMRRGIWYKALTQVERALLDLTVQVVDRVESIVLGVELVKILVKLRNVVKGGFTRRMEEYGVLQARKISSKAVEWGYKIAASWSSNSGFIRYLTIIDVNKPKGYGV
jgi:hypothetical protein